MRKQKFNKKSDQLFRKINRLPQNNFFLLYLQQGGHKVDIHTHIYRTRAIITRSWFETALDYKPRILDPKIEEFPCLVHKLSVILTALQYKLQ